MQHRARPLIASVLAVATLIAAIGTPALAKKNKPPLAFLDETTWIFRGEYKVSAKRTGLKDAYALEFLVDFFDDGTFVLQDLPIDEEAEFFSGSWSQNGNKTILVFDDISRLILTDIFEEQFLADFGEPVDVYIDTWQISTKLKVDKADTIYIRFKEKLRHQAIFDGIPIRVKTKGKGDAGFVPPEELE